MMIDYWVIPNETKKALVKAERYEIADGVLRFYVEDKEVAFFRWDGVVGVQIGEPKEDKLGFVMPKYEDGVEVCIL